MDKNKIFLIYHGSFETDLLESIANDLSVEIHYPIELIENQIELDSFYDQQRRQYDGNWLLKEIDLIPVSKNVLKVGLFRIDLFIPILTYIFGQAILMGNSAIVSTYRLRNEHYGLPQDRSLLIDRFAKTIMHEIGHMLGLKHCLIPGCVMKSSTYVEDMDQKELKYCINCRTLSGLSN